MATRQQHLFESQRLQLDEALALTVESLTEYGSRYPHWGIAWSWGKDSTAVATLVAYLIDSGRVPRPESVTVLAADTRLELLPLAESARLLSADLKDCGFDVRRVIAPLDARFMVNILGRGVTPPNSMTQRWCTRQIKIDPMKLEVARLVADKGGTDNFLMLTGVRVGESAARDNRIALACTKDGAECGQGWFQHKLGEAGYATLAPIVHWRVCHVWQWLGDIATRIHSISFNTSLLAAAYGGDEAEEKNARMGCVGCTLVQEDKALNMVCAKQEWAYLSPLKRIRGIWDELRSPRHRLRKPAGGTGNEAQRMGPLTMAARAWGLSEILSIQAEVNAAALDLGATNVDVLNGEEEARVHEMWAENVWPAGWTGTEPVASTLMDMQFRDGTVQPIFPALAEWEWA